jgi:hypothetical protein
VLLHNILHNALLFLQVLFPILTFVEDVFHFLHFFFIGIFLLVLGFRFWKNHNFNEGH